MTLAPDLAGILIGGLLAAVFFGFSGVFSKAAAQSGIGLGAYALFVGIGVLAVGLVAFLLLPEARAFKGSSAAAAALTGALWATGAVCVGYAMLMYLTPISKLAPMYNTNTLVTVGVGLIVFAEWRTANMWQLLLGATLITVGGVLVSKA